MKCKFLKVFFLKDLFSKESKHKRDDPLYNHRRSLLRVDPKKLRVVSYNSLGVIY